MNLTISDKGLKKNNITFDEYLMLISIYRNKNTEEILKSLVIKGLVYTDINNLSTLTTTGREIIDDVNVDSDKDKSSDERILSLAKRLKEVFPKGKKEGTNNYWADSITIISKRLLLFFKKYNQSLKETYNDQYSEDFIDDKIVKAAENYVKSFNGSYRYMRILKYFIFKEELNANREVESTSTLLDCMENEDQDNTYNSDWTTDLIV